MVPRAAARAAARPRSRAAGRRRAASCRPRPSPPPSPPPRARPTAGSSGRLQARGRRRRPGDRAGRGRAAQPGRAGARGRRHGPVRRRVPLPAAPRHLALAGARRPGARARRGRRRAALGRAPGRRVTRAPTGREPHDAAAAGGRVFVADEFAHTLTVLDGRAAGHPHPHALQPGGVTPLDRGRRSRSSPSASASSRCSTPRPGERTGRAPAGVGPTHAVSDGGNYLFVTDTAGGALLVYHLRPALELIRRYPLPGSPYGIAVDTARARLFVTQTARNQLTELSARRPPVAHPPLRDAAPAEHGRRRRGHGARVRHRQGRTACFSCSTRERERTR